MVDGGWRGTLIGARPRISRIKESERIGGARQAQRCHLSNPRSVPVGSVRAADPQTPPACEVKLRSARTFPSATWERARLRTLRTGVRQSAIRRGGGVRDKSRPGSGRANPQFSQCVPARAPFQAPGPARGAQRFLRLLPPPFAQAGGAGENRADSPRARYAARDLRMWRAGSTS